MIEHFPVMGQGRVYGVETRSDIVRKLKRTMFTHTCVLLLLPLQLFVLSSAEELRCSVTRLQRAGDRIRFVDYNGSCNKRVNPCQRIEGSEWKYSSSGCICQCKRSTSTYREDNRYCVANNLNRKGCTLLFSRERNTDNLRVFNNSNSIKLSTLPKETCEAKATYYITNEIMEGWKQLPGKTPAFFIRHEDRSKNGHAHFLQWKDDKPVAALFGKIVKVNIDCVSSKRDVSSMPRRLCILFKVKGSITLPCLAGIPSTNLPISDTSTAETMTATMITPNNTRPSNETTQKPVTDVIATVTVEPNTTPPPSQPSNMDVNGGRASNIDEKVALPIWLIAVIAVGAVVGTLSITAIIWICCKMKQRSRRRRRKRTKCGNPVYNNDDDDTVITFATSGVGSGVDEAGYARVGNPCRKGYAFLKTGPDRCRSEYQKLVKPGEDHSGYLVPVEERTPTLPPTPMLENPPTTDTAIYSEAASPPPQDKPKSKDYDYAKPEDFIALTASRSSLDKLDAHETGPGYVAAKEDSESNDIVPSSPLYTTVMGPSSPELPTEGASQDLPSEDTTSENDEGIDTKHEYVELLPDAGSESGGTSLVKEKDCLA